MRSLLTILALSLLLTLGARAQTFFSKVEVHGTIYSTNSLGQLEARPLTNQRIKQLCGLTTNLGMYTIVVGSSDEETSRSGLFVVDKYGTIIQSFFEYPIASDSNLNLNSTRSTKAVNTPTNGTLIGNFDHGYLLLPLTSILGYTDITGTTDGLTGQRNGIVHFVGAIDESGSPHFIMRGTFRFTGKFHAAALPQ